MSERSWYSMAYINMQVTWPPPGADWCMTPSDGPRILVYLTKNYRLVAGEMGLAPEPPGVQNTR